MNIQEVIKRALSEPLFAEQLKAAAEAAFDADLSSEAGVNDLKAFLTLFPMNDEELAALMTPRFPEEGGATPGIRTAPMMIANAAKSTVACTTTTTTTTGSRACDEALD